MFVCTSIVSSWSHVSSCFIPCPDNHVTPLRAFVPYLCACALVIFRTAACKLEVKDEEEDGDEEDEDEEEEDMSVVQLYVEKQQDQRDFGVGSMKQEEVRGGKAAPTHGGA